MFLKEIVIHGFKSFADRTKIVLQPGVTCIVGPNGCGKSNIVDAIRWVLGEQSAKALRGGKMQDVIFEGTDTRKPLAVCEVSLVFTECEDQLGTAFHEVEITRRATREDGSDYCLNGKSCRLKDIQRLFMDTGIGRVSYSFMLQGQIDQILSTNPAERRIIFEEAAGITKYKSQRYEALQKLTAVQQNLARVTDVMAEINRQMASLKRQAIRAIYYQKLKHWLTHLDLAHLAFQYGQRQEAIEVLQKQADQLTQALTQKQAILTQLEAQIQKKRSDRSFLSETVQKTQETVYTFKTQREEALHCVHLAQTRSQDMVTRLDNLNKEIEALKVEINRIHQRAWEETKNEQLQLNLVGECDSVLKTRVSEFEVLNTQVQKAELGLQTARAERERLEQDIRRLRTQLINHEVTVQTAQAQKASGEESLGQMKQNLESAQERLEALMQKENACVAERQQAQAAQQEADKALQEIRLSFRSHQEALQKADREYSLRRGELQMLEGLQAKLEGCSEAARAVLSGKLGDACPKDDFRLLTNYLEVDEDYSTALEAFLGVAADALVPTSNLNWIDFSQIVWDKKIGRVCLSVPAAAFDSKPSKYEGLRPFADFVRITDASYVNIFKNLLHDVYLAQDLESFLQIWKAHPSLHFRYIVTVRGDLIDCRGLIYTGDAGSGKGLIQRRVQIKKLQATIETVLTSQSELQAKTEHFQTNLQKAEASLDVAQRHLNQVSQSISGIGAEKRVADTEVKRLTDLWTKQQEQLTQAQQRMITAEQSLKQTQVQVEQSDVRLAQIVTQLQEQELLLQAQRKQRDDIQALLSTARLELSEKRQRLDALKSGANRLIHEQTQLKNRLASREQEFNQSKAQSGGWLEDAKTAQAQATALEAQLNQASAALEKLRGDLAQLEAGIRTEEAQLTASHHAWREEEKAHLTVARKLAENQATFAGLIEKAQLEYSVMLVDVSIVQQLEQANQPITVNPEVLALEADDSEPLTTHDYQLIDPQAPDWAVIGRQIKALRTAIVEIAGVNLAAIDEYTQLKQRSDFLNAQSADLTQAREEVLKAIEELNETSRTLFEATFKKVQANFEATFEKLFGGGVAKLELVDKEDPLESGIDIIACPPGTRLKNLTLLSGGQKTMTAVALLFSIYQVKPSPFCVLDELDAPLDDANIGRFTGILREFTEFSQFLVISHSKRTIAAANTLYGVTMPERGVTQLVSLKFEEHRETTEAVIF